MNLAQQIFLVFFAIFWGTSANAWPRWKAFHWTFFFHSTRIRTRILWSLVMLNIAPLFFFYGVLMRLGRYAGNDALSLRELAASVVPAFAIFGLYRLWIAGIEFAPSRFYCLTQEEQKAQEPKLHPSDTTIEELRLTNEPWALNLLFGLAYVLVAGLFGAFF